MDQTDFAIAMVSGVLIIISIFLFILFRIFGKKKKTWPIVTLLPETTKIGPHESRPEKFVIRPQEIEGLEKEFRMARDYQRMEPVKEIIMEKKEDIKEETIKGSAEPIKEIFLTRPVLQSVEENEKLRLEDFLIGIRDENTHKKAKKKSYSGKSLEKAGKLKKIKNPEKRLITRPVRKKPGKKVILMLK